MCLSTLGVLHVFMFGCTCCSTTLLCCAVLYCTCCAVLYCTCCAVLYCTCCATGISLWDSVVVNYVGRTFGHLQILQYFHQFALPLHAIHYFCLSVVLVSLLERLSLLEVRQSFTHSSIFATRLHECILLKCR